MSSLDYLDLCRLCLVKDRVSVPIFEDEGDVRQIFLKITACLPVKVSREDKLPKKICDDCVYKVELFYQFWNTTANAEKQLLQWLGEVGGLEENQSYVTEVLDSNVMKQERSSDSRLDASVMQVGGHQNNMDMGMIDNMSLITMPTGNEQFTSVPMDTTSAVQTVQAVPGSSTQTTHDQMSQNRTAVTHLVEEEEESEDEENSDDGCDNEEGLPVKEETEEDPSDQPLEPTTFVNVSIPCDEAGPSGLQQQKISEISEMTIPQTADGDSKTGYNVEAAITSVDSNSSLKCSSMSSSMTLYQISYVNGKPSYSLVAIKSKSEAGSSKNSEAKSNKILRCEECGLKFASEVRLNWHRSTHDPLKQHKAGRKQLKIARHRYEDAGIAVLNKPRKQSLKSYVETEEAAGGFSEVSSDQQNSTLDNRILTFICPSCEFSTSERSLMIEHFTVIHCLKSSQLKIEFEEQQTIVEDQDNGDTEPQFEPVELTCSQCGYSSINQDDIDFHTCLPSEEQMFSCHLCTYECLTRMGLQSHITRKHKPKPEGGEPRSYECDSCDFKCANKNTLYSHKRKHRTGKVEIGIEEEPSYFCNECDFSAKRKGSLYLHIQRRHKATSDLKQSRPNFYSCDQCDYTNKNKYEMKVHVIRKHTNEYNHECETCGKKYKIRGDLTNHIRFQHREQPIICDVCGKTCGNSNSLYVHQKFAHYKAEFECPICHRRMVSQANLDEHILKQHEQREDAVCEECGKTFSRQSRLKIHMRIHSGVKPHSCKICGKAFSRKTALRQHLLIHTGQRPYVCDICGKAFTQKPGLISHRKSHPGSHPPLPRVTIDHVLSELLTDEC